MLTRRFSLFFRGNAGLSSPGFTLVEVVIALGIFAFAIIALVGLLSTGLQTEKAARRDTAMGNIVSYVLSDLHGSKYSTVTGDTLAATKTSFFRWYEFDEDGVFLLSGTNGPAPAPSTNAMYLCTAAGQQVSSPMRMQVTGTIEFPLQAVSANREKQIFATSLTPYEATKQ